MSDQAKKVLNSLVPTGRRELVAGSALIKRGLVLLEEQALSKRRVHVVIGNLEPAMNPYFVKVTDAAGGGRYEIIPHAMDSVEALTEHARHNPVDLFILVLNNILIASKPKCQFAERIHQVLTLTSWLKTTCRKPIVVLAGNPSTPTLPDIVLSAGADAFFSLPPSDADFRESVKTLLSRSA